MFGYNDELLVVLWCGFGEGPGGVMAQSKDMVAWRKKERVVVDWGEQRSSGCCSFYRQRY